MARPTPSVFEDADNRLDVQTDAEVKRIQGLVEQNIRGRINTTRARLGETLIGETPITEIDEASMRRESIALPAAPFELPEISIAGTRVRPQVNLQDAYFVDTVQTTERMAQDFNGMGQGQLTACGITNLPAGVWTLSAEEARALAEAIGPIASIRRTFEGAGVSEANVQAATDIFAQNAPIVARALGGGGNIVDRDIRQVDARRTTLSILRALDGLTVTRTSFADLQTRLGHIDHDLVNLIAGATMQFPDLLAQIGVATLPTPLPTSVAQNYRQFLQSKRTEVAKEMNEYEKIANVLVTVRDVVNNAGLNIPSALGSYSRVSVTNVNPVPVPIASLTAGLDPGQLSRQIQSQLNITSDGELAAERQKLVEKKGDGIQGRKSLSGREAVLAAYRSYFESQRGMSPQKAQVAAQEMFGRYETGPRDVANIQRRVEMAAAGEQEVPSRWKRTGEWVKGKLYGPPDDFVGNMRRSMKNRGCPYPELVLYHAFKKALADRDIPNIPSVREAMQIEAGKLAHRNVRQLSHTLGMHRFTEGEQTEIRRQGEREARERSVSDALLSDLSAIEDGSTRAYYQGEVDYAIQYARKWTGWKRRGVGRFTRGTAGLALSPLGIGPWATWKNPVAWPAKITGKTLKFTFYTAPRGVLGGVQRAAGGLWGWLNKETYGPLSFGKK